MKDIPFDSTAVEISLTFDMLDIREQEIMSALGYAPGTAPGEDISKLVQEIWIETSGKCRPRFAYRILAGTVTGKSDITIGEYILKPGGIIARCLEKSEYFALLTGTVGEEMDRWMHSENISKDIMKTYIADAFGSVIAESIISFGLEHVGKTAAEKGFRITNSYSPGYCGWNVSEQHKFFGLMPERICGIRLCGSGLMMPIKSVSSIAGIGKEVTKKPYGCKICNKKDCYKRKYDKAPNLAGDD